MQHLLQCSFNSYVQSSLYVGDWDMWWSDDAQAVKNGVLRAMSGGPVYVSDKLGRSIKEAISPIIYQDGRIILLRTPALPAKDCLTEDAEHNGRIFKIWNRIGDCGVLAAFNLDSEEREVTGAVSAGDIPGLKDERYAIYDYFAKTAKALPRGQQIDISLRNYDDFRLLLLIPIRKGIAPIGLTDKYMVPATWEAAGANRWRVKEGGEFAIYSENPLTAVFIDGVSAPVEKRAANLFTVFLQNAGELSLPCL